MKKNYKQLLNESFREATPEQSEELRQTSVVPATEQPAPARKSARRWKIGVGVGVGAGFGIGTLATACVAMLVVAAVIVGVVFGMRTPSPAPGPGTVAPESDYRSYITVSVNPAFSLSVDHDGSVQNVVAENYDGEIVLDSIEDDGITLDKSYDTVVQLLVSYTRTLGYFATGNEIRVDIYNYSANQELKEDMRSHIRAAAEAAAEKKLGVSTGELDRAAVLEMAGKIAGTVLVELDDDDLYKIIKEKKSYRDTRPQRPSSESPGGVGGNMTSPASEDEAVWKLATAGYTVSAMQRINQLMAGIAVYCTLRDITPEEFFLDNGYMPRTMRESVNELLTWLGDSRTLTFENYETIAAQCKLSPALSAMDDPEELLEDYLDGDEDVTVAMLVELAEELLADENVYALHTAMDAKHLRTDGNTLFRDVTQLEKSFRKAAHGAHSIEEWYEDLFEDEDDEDDHDDRKDDKDDRKDDKDD